MLITSSLEPVNLLIFAFSDMGLRVRKNFEVRIDSETLRNRVRPPRLEGQATVTCFDTRVHLPTTAALVKDFLDDQA
jgi:hypothetical protein